jgi:hypothetical protein
MTSSNPSKDPTELGPLRFAPSDEERSLQAQLDALTDAERTCLDHLKSKWQAQYPQTPLSDAMVLRFARCSPGATKFNEKAAWKVMKHFDMRYLTLTASSLESQLLSKVCLITS